MAQGVVNSDGIFKWSNNDNNMFDADGGLSEVSESSEQSMNSRPLKPDVGSACELEVSEAANQRLKLSSPKDSNDEKAQLAQTLLSLRPLGLTLGNLPSFLDLNQTKPRKRKAKHTAAEMNAYQLMTEREKLKASNFSGKLLRIGTWEKVAHNEGDLVAKCYYAKRKLVWEILDQGLKNKIEVQWSDIVAIRAVIGENEPGILEIELSQLPTFHRESNPQPRKHTMWNVASDFTNGQALINRRHYLEFPPGALDKHYEKLIQCESRFFELSQRPFPSRRSPYFNSDFQNGFADFTFNFNRHEQEIPCNRQLSFSPCIQARLDPTQQVQAYEQTKPPLRIKDSTSPISVMDFSSPLDEVISNHGIQYSHMPHWDQGINRAVTNFADFREREQLPGLVSVAAAADEVDQNSSCENFDAYTQALVRANLEAQMLSNIENQLFLDSQVIPDANSLIGCPEQVNTAVISDTKHTHYGQDMTGRGHLFSGATDRLFQPHPIDLMTQLPQPVGSWMQSQGSSQNSEMHMAESNSTYSSFCQVPTMEEFAAFNNLANRWTHDPQR